MKCLVVGLGSIGQRHVRNLRTLLGNEVDLLACRTRGLRHVITPAMHAEPDSDVERRYNIRSFSDLDTALAEGPDAVFVTNPNSLHIPVAKAAAQAGCHVFLEKPISHDLTGCAELADEIERRSLVCMVGYQIRFHPLFRLLQSLVRDRRVGALLGVRIVFGEYFPGWHPYEDYRQSPVGHRALGGGVLLAQIHDLDCIYALFGLPSKVFALGGHFSNLEIDADDCVSMLMECGDGERRWPVHVHQDLLQRPGTRIYEVIGDDGKIVADFTALSVQVFDAEGHQTLNQSFAGFERNTLFLDELRHFLDCIHSGVTPLISFDDGLQSLRMALAARTSIETGRAVELTA